MGGGPVGERGARAGGEERGDHAPAVAQRLVADRVDAAVDPQQPPPLTPGA